MIQRQTRLVAVVCFAFAMVQTVFPLANAAPPRPEEVGRELFAYEWQIGDPRSAQGDGLGPLYNARSCATCHQRGGLGGTSGLEQNLLVVTQLDLSVPDFSRKMNRITAEEFATAPLRFASFLSDLLPKRSFILHAHGRAADYQSWRADWLRGLKPSPPSDFSLPRQAKLRYGERDGRRFFVSERNAPALFGAGRINRIPADALHALAAAQANDRDGVAGRVSVVGDDVGRFGWRAQIASLHDFVGSACANELGLQVDGHPQAEDPLAEFPVASGNDLEARDVEAMTAFVADLPAPRPLTSPDKHQMAGRELFQKIGCATCHVERVVDVDGLYSDLLLHDMGPELADGPAGSDVRSFPVPIAMPAIDNSPNGRRGVFTVTPADYLGAFGSMEATSSVWRTPPLWGVADTAPYLHDGRAESLPDAILAHGGEAARAATRFRRLSPSRKRALIAFLEGLRGPEAP